MPRKPKTIPGPSRLSGILAQLTKEPRPFLPNLKSLQLTYAYRNDHFGARHFVKEELPRIRYANPTIDIRVNKVPKTKDETLVPEMVVELKNGTTRTLNMDGKWSSAIYHELMDLTAGSWWQRWKNEQAAAGISTTPYPPPQKKSGVAAVLP
ncbi:hypothetical protein BD309DRAFT_954380 [Dichomitus squalens]|uniref:Uncharacterized protein n=1 Tax=Dichomitus squalens TaxID=114155 RepID=A0A4Q9PPM4_9APHY|nr:hypothetical protein BD309DRAFT_954380 [Dichomitus squalens]TBU56206.1 hypothetical protein BD310DRAFT_931873 [Dichomitus squalens]